MVDRVLSWAGRDAVRLFTRLMLDMDVRWLEQPLPGAKILVANHPSTTDPFYLLAITQEPVSVLVTDVAFQLPVFGWYLRASGHVPAVRDSGGATVEALRRKLEAGCPVAIFPEGTLSPAQGGFHQPHTGAARLALITGAPVIPVGIGLDRSRAVPITPRICGHTEFGRLYLRGHYAVTVGEPMWFNGNSDDWPAVRSVAGQVMRRIIQLADQSAHRIEKSPAHATRAAWLAHTPV